MNQTIITDLLASLIAGLLGSIHCIGMCGPLAGYGCRTSVRGISLLSPGMFVFGKLLSYALLGAAMGWIGEWLLQIMWMPKAIAWLSIVIGAALVLVVLLEWILPNSPLHRFSTRFLSRISQRWLQSKSANTNPLLLPFGLGLLAALLPCGLLHGMLLRSAATISPLLGMANMVAFGLGTSPALLGIAVIANRLPAWFKRYSSRFGEVFLLALGAMMMARGIMLLMQPEKCPLCH